MSATATATMAGYVLTEPGRAELTEVAVPRPGYGEVLVKVTKASICATDLKIVDGRFPVDPGRVMGHEFIGELVEVGVGIEGLEIGTRLFVHCDTPCGQCYECLGNVNGQGCHARGSLNAFHFGVLRDGAHAEYVAVPYAASNVVPIPEAVSDEQALMLCDVGSTGFAGIESSDLRFGDVVAIVGQGPVGLAATVAARLRGAALIAVVDASHERLEQALGMGADIALHSGEVDVVAEIGKLTDGRMADVAVEAVGLPATFVMALRLTRPAGTLSSIGNYGMQGELSLPLDEGGFVGGVGNKRIVSTTSPGGKDRARRLLELVANGKLDLGSFVTHHYPLAEIDAAYDLFREKRDGVFKVAVTP
jgi:alcohol dehydrogenase